ncbi:MAG: FtsQ-type POTRA domain-containing protein [Alphaproteobacteria bacterium]|jgi:cell division septal protein FtsQ|nr:FtsQ-type POTRA domain-containing protein [Alphaproteobacteria bacterium]
MIYKNFNIKTFFLSIVALSSFVIGIISFEEAKEKEIYRFEKVDINNVKDFPIEDVEKKISKFIGMNMEDIDIEYLKEDLLNLGWVKNVSVRKKFPDQIIMTFIEKVPFAVWKRNGKFLFIEEDGSVINYPIKFSHTDFILVENRIPPSNLKEFFSILDQSKYIKEKVLSIKKISNRRYDIKLKSFDNTILIKLPEEEVLSTLKRLEKMDVERDFLKRNVNEIDARNSDWIIR